MENSPKKKQDRFMDMEQTNQKPRVLVIDDDAVTIRLMEKLLEDRYDISTASSGLKALEMICNSSFDLVLLDWMLPGMDGLSLLIALKADETTKDMPVLFVSGMTESEHINKGLEAGAAGFLSKPFSKNQILESIGKALLNKTIDSTVEQYN